MDAVRKAGQRVVVGEIGDTLGRPSILGNIGMNGNVAAVGKDGHHALDDAAIVHQPFAPTETTASCCCGGMSPGPSAELGAGALSAAHFGREIGDCRAGSDIFVCQVEELTETDVGKRQPLFGVEDAETERQVVENDFEEFFRPSNA